MGSRDVKRGGGGKPKGSVLRGVRNYGGYEPSRRQEEERKELYWLNLREGGRSLKGGSLNRKR